jgi:hypothetical protein
VDFNSSAKKAELVKLFSEHITPNAPSLLRDKINPYFSIQKVGQWDVRFDQIKNIAFYIVVTFPLTRQLAFGTFLSATFLVKEVQISTMLLT